MKPLLKLMLLCLLMFFENTGLRADVILPALISHNMVLQQKTKVALWGWANPHEKIWVKPQWQCFKSYVVADENGHWLIRVQTPKAGGPYTIIIEGEGNRIELNDVLVGEVWICSGQSNMAWEVKQCADAEKEIEASAYPEIRLFTVKRTISDAPQVDSRGSWSKCSPDSVVDFSATAYYFGRYLHSKLDVPIGLIHSSWGGTFIEAWMKSDVLLSDSDYKPIFDRYKKWVENYPATEKKYQRELADWKKAAKQAKSDKKKLLPKPRYYGIRHQNCPSSLYNGMISPLTNYTMAGVIWYQGESNRNRAFQYRKLFVDMIESWREDWGLGSFPFYYVQIAPYKYAESDPVAAELRESQLMALKISNTGMVVTTDIGNLENIHPKNKQEVGRRLALWAINKTYGQSGLVCSGPIYKAMKAEGSRIRLYFDHTAGGLICKGKELSCFTIAGSDRNFMKAKAIIEGDTIVVENNDVREPVAVRFAWSNIAEPNLFNTAGLPASPFRTDDFNGITFKVK